MAFLMQSDLIPTTKVLVCGGRTYGTVPKDTLKENLEAAKKQAEQEVTYLYEVLNRVHEKMGIATIIHGNARGADTLAGLWAKGKRVNETRFCADWNKHGKGAGPIRNAQMLSEGNPTIVIAFPGGDGTKNMIEQATKAGVPIYEVSYVVQD